jgi:hypothetical protein
MKEIDLVKQKEIALGQREPNMIMESKEEIIDTIAKADYSGFDNFSVVMTTGRTDKHVPKLLFQIKKGDPIQVIKETNIGTKQTDVIYFLRKHNGKTYAQTKQELSKQPIFKPDNSTFSGWTVNKGIASGLFYNMNTLSYRLPNNVVEEQSVVDKVKQLMEMKGNVTITDKIFGHSTMFGRPRTIPFMVVGAIVGGYYAKSKSYSTLLGVVVGGFLPLALQEILHKYDRSKMTYQVPKSKVPFVASQPTLPTDTKSGVFQNITREECERQGKMYVDVMCAVPPCPAGRCIDKAKPSEFPLANA